MPDTSLLSPSDTNHEMPIDICVASCSSDAPSDPDCNEIATPPAGSPTGTSAAWTPTDGASVVASVVAFDGAADSVAAGSAVVVGVTAGSDDVAPSSATRPVATPMLAGPMIRMP